nr:uncharacterized protein K02A2.6-like [Halyomorpha halys]
MTSARLLRCASFLSGLDYTVRCKKGKDNENVECLSRAPVTIPSNAPAIAVDAEVNALYAETLLQISSSAITADTIAEETARNPELRALIKDLKNNPKDSPFTIANDMLFRLDHAVISKALQPQILEELHATHLGITKMKQRARRYLYWERIDKDIERLVKSCEPCARVRITLRRSKFILEICQRRTGRECILTMRAPSKNPSLCGLMRDPLENVLSIHGYPSVMVSDNASRAVNSRTVVKNE